MLSAPPTDHERIKSYLLGQLAEQDESDIEARLLTDHRFFEELSIVEDDLVDKYLSGGLSDSERRSFESHFVSSPERKQKIRFARALRKYLSISAEPERTPIGAEIVSDSPERPVTLSRTPRLFAFQRPLISYAMVAAVLIIAVGSLLLLLRYWQSPAMNGEVLAIELTPTPATRGSSEVKQFNITPNIESVRLQLDLPTNEYPSYVAVVSDPLLRTVLHTKNLKPQRVNNFYAVVFDVKANLLSPGDYRIHLSGITSDSRSESVATFSFTVGAK